MSHQVRDELFDNELRSLVSEGYRNEAVIRYRKRTGATLKDATNAVEELVRQQGISQRQSDSVDWDVTSMLEDGRKTQAVKLYRERMGSSLEEAKEAVERISQDHHIPKSQGRGCLGVMSLAIALMVFIVIATK